MSQSIWRARVGSMNAQIMVYCCVVMRASLQWTSEVGKWLPHIIQSFNVVLLSRKIFYDRMASLAHGKYWLSNSYHGVFQTNQRRCIPHLSVAPVECLVAELEGGVFNRVKIFSPVCRTVCLLHCVVNRVTKRVALLHYVCGTYPLELAL
jgi:hypothetical protein